MNKSLLLKEIIQLQKLRAEKAKNIIGMAIQNPVKARSFYQEILESSNNYVRYQTTNYELDLYFIAYKTKSQFSLEEFYSLIPFFSVHTLPPEYYLFQILDIFDFFNAKKGEEIRVKLFLHEKDKISVFNEIGFHPFSYSMIGSTEDGINCIKGELKDVSEEVEISSMSFNRDYKPSVEPLFNLSFENEPENWEFPLNPSYKDFLRKRETKIASMKEEGLQIITKVDKKAVGYISAYIDRAELFPQDTGIIFEMVIHPDYHNSKVRFMLYNEALQFFKKHNMDYFFGTSGSKNVLALAHKLHRKVFSLSMRLVYSPDIRDRKL